MSYHYKCIELEMIRHYNKEKRRCEICQVWFELSEDRFSAENDKRYTHEEVFANLRRKING